MHPDWLFYLYPGTVGFTDTIRSARIASLRFSSGCTKRIDGRDAASQIVSGVDKVVLLL